MVLPNYWGSLLPMVDTDDDAAPDSLAVETHNGDLAAIRAAAEDTTPVDVVDSAAHTDDSAFAVGTSEVLAAGFLGSETSPDSVDEGDIGTPRMTLDRKIIVHPRPNATGGLSIHKNLDVDETEDDIKTSAGQIYGWVFTNLTSATLYVKFYNATAANVTVGTTTPVMTIPIPGNSTDAVTGFMLGAMGIEFSTAISIAATTGLADNNTGAPAANALVATVFYK